MPSEHAHAAGPATRVARGGQGGLPDVGWRGIWPRGAGFGALCLALLLLPGWIAGGAPLAGLKVFLFYSGWVLLPGIALAALLGREEDGLLSAGMGLVLGTVLVGLVVFVGRATGQFVVLYVWPVATLIFLALARRQAAEPRSPAASRGSTRLYLAVLALVLLNVPATWGIDLVFHGGNAAELLHRGPLVDPRVAGRPLNYHLLSHALAAGASAVTGESIADLFQFWYLGMFPLALTMLVFGLARELGKSTWAGVIAVLVLVLHNDLGQGLLGEGFSSPFGFQSYLSVGLFYSPTTCLGLALLAALALALVRWVEPGRSVGPREGLELTLLAMGASMAKGSVMPPVIAGAFFAFLVASVRERRPSRRWLSAACVLLLASLPATLFLSFGPGSYAEAMFRLAPWATATTTGMGLWLLERVAFFQRTPTWLDGLLLTIPWLPGFLGLGGIGSLAWLAAGRPSLRGIGAWILGVSLASLGAGVLLLAPGYSQLFFAYNAQLLLALPAGVGAVALWQRRRGVALGLTLLALPFLAAGVGGIVRRLSGRVHDARSVPRLWPQWREGAAWLREHSSGEALLVTLDDGLFLTHFAERRVVLAGTFYTPTPESHAKRWIREGGQWRVGTPVGNPFPLMKRACKKVLQSGDRAVLAQLRRVTGHTGELYLVVSNLDVSDYSMLLGHGYLAGEPMLDSTHLDASPALERCFRNEAISIYRAVD